MSELNVYLLPGMGADRRLYDPIDLRIGKQHYLEWEHIPGVRTMREYAAQLVEDIETENNVYVGSSLGGMMAVEMHHLKPSNRLILLSAPASRLEFPPLLKSMASVSAGKWFSPRQLYKLNRFADTFMGFRSEAERALFYEMLRGYEPEFLYFALNAILNWDRTELPENYVQIIGDKDALFKKKRMQSPILVEGSGHFMTFEQSETLTDLLNKELERIAEELGDSRVISP